MLLFKTLEILKIKKKITILKVFSDLDCDCNVKERKKNYMQKNENHIILNFRAYI